ncbi:MAG: carboxypeptidase regulatory-like domain-containing protein [Bacteroidetes bacterium]|nr:carboxypeptidase regulatory-like domain-containing protein [Bacteroidota bacterium]
MKRLQLNIPTPCHENWNNMSASEKGRYCAACSKEVVDFTTMSDAALLQYFSSLTNEKVCGRVYADQLDRVISKPQPPKKKWLWYWHYVTMLFLFFGKGSTAKSQVNNMVVSSRQLDSIRRTNINEALADPWANLQGDVIYAFNKKVINGRVINTSGNPVPFASIRIMKSSILTFADAAGYFNINANVEHDTLLISGSQVQSREFALRSQKNEQYILQESYASNDVVVTVGRVQFRDADEIPDPPVSQKYVSVLEIKDYDDQKPVSNVSLEITTVKTGQRSHVYTNAKGVFKIKKMEQYDRYLVTVSKEGYEPYEFEVNVKDKDQRKTYQEVLLRKKVKAVISKNDRMIVMGGVLSIKDTASRLVYILDGTLFRDSLPGNFDFNTIEEVTLLQPTAATALFGVTASAGAMVITTKKTTVKKEQKAISSPAIDSNSLHNKRVQNVIAGKNDISIFPNPVAKGNTMNISMPAQSSGSYVFQVMNASGIVLVKKQYTVAANSSPMQLKIEPTWVSGLYYLCVFDDKSQFASINSFMIQ